MNEIRTNKCSWNNSLRNWVKFSSLLNLQKKSFVNIWMVLNNTSFSSELFEIMKSFTTWNYTIPILSLIQQHDKFSFDIITSFHSDKCVNWNQPIRNLLKSKHYDNKQKLRFYISTFLRYKLLYKSKEAKKLSLCKIRFYLKNKICSSKY